MDSGAGLALVAACIHLAGAAGGAALAGRVLAAIGGLLRPVANPAACLANIDALMPAAAASAQPARR